MKTKRPIFAAVSGDKKRSGKAQSEGAAHDAAAHRQGENDSRSAASMEPAEGDIATDDFYQRLMLGAATIDELLSDDAALPDEPYGDTDVAARRLSAWCRASTGGDQALFERRLARDGRSLAEVLARFGAAGRNISTAHMGPAPAWLDDARWIEAALQSRTDSLPLGAPDGTEPYAFEQLFLPVLEAAEARLRRGHR